MRDSSYLVDYVPDTYLQAETLLNKVQSRINRIGMTFPDITSFDFELEKYRFKKLPSNVSKGVRAMGLHLEEDYRSLIVSYNRNSYILPHLHSSEIEVIQVLEGEIKDEVNCIIYEEGDIIRIEKDQLHYMTTKNKRSILFLVFSEHVNVINNLLKYL